jgi:hypothetical protein
MNRLLWKQGFRAGRGAPLPVARAMSPDASASALVRNAWANRAAALRN